MGKLNREEAGCGGEAGEGVALPCSTPVVLFCGGGNASSPEGLCVSSWVDVGLLWKGLP